MTVLSRESVLRTICPNVFVVCLVEIVDSSVLSQRYFVEYESASCRRIFSLAVIPKRKRPTAAWCLKQVLKEMIIILSDLRK